MLISIRGKREKRNIGLRDEHVCVELSKKGIAKEMSPEFHKELPLKILGATRLTPPPPRDATPLKILFDLSEWNFWHVAYQ